MGLWVLLKRCGYWGGNCCRCKQVHGVRVGVFLSGVTHVEWKGEVLLTRPDVKMHPPMRVYILDRLT